MTRRRPSRRPWISIAIAITALMVGVASVLTDGEASVWGARINWWSANTSVMWGPRSGAGETPSFELSWHPGWHPRSPDWTRGRIALPVGAVFPVLGGVWIAIRFALIRKQTSRSLCSRCRFPLYGLKSTRCPECGEPVATT